MKLPSSIKYACSAFILVLSGVALSSASTAGPAAKPAELRNTNVIVILRDQMLNMPGARGAHATRASALAGAQAPIVSHMRASGASRIHQFQLINAVSATVSPAEREALAAHPLVQAVVPEVTITLPRRVKTEPSQANSGAAASSKSGSQALCGTLEPEALQLMHVAYLNPSTPQAQRVRDGNGDFVTGKGVKVAWIADGLDPTIAGFTHTDGTPVFVDFQDFSGDPAGTPTPGGEAFGDASSIAANDTPNGKVLTFDLGQFVVKALGTLPVSPCNIRVRGVAPGASLVGLKVFSSIGSTTNTTFVQAIEYAVLHDDVDVINESFGGNPFPDNTNDPISLADQAAVRAGVTVVASTGDAGYNGTLGSPSTDSVVISSGATTQLRSYAQIGYGASFFATNGWINNNLSAFSSGGFSISGPRVPDTVAPGDTGWALCSTNGTLYTECPSFLNGTPSPIEFFGGTSESSPLTAGTAALIIQAYRSTHRGADPSPALVKQILMSTATDLGAPPSEQGAGFIDALRAVEAALSVDAPKSTSGTGNGLLNNPTSFSIDAEPNAPQSVTVAITNTGAASQQLEPKLQALGPPIAGASTVVTLSKSSPIFPSPGDLPRFYVLQKFTVPADAEHLDTAIAWLAPFNGPAVTAELGLIDPNGHDMGYTVPQGASSGYGHFDVNHPAPGVWTAVIWTSASSQTYLGPVQFSWGAERYVSAGSVSPASFDLAPGATKWITARFSTPRQPGDSSIAIRFPSSGGGHSEIPIALRTLIPISVNGGFFTGTLTGSNGRGAPPTQTFAFNVPPGVNNMSLGLQVLDNFYLLEGLLIDPNGMQLSVEPNVDAAGNTAFAMQLNRAHPMAGRWRFILLLNYFTSGKQTSLPFTAQIGLDTAQVNATGLPHSPSSTVSASAPLTVPITITNSGGLSQAYFADARLDTFTTLAFGTAPVCTANGQLVTNLPYGCWATLLPTQVRTVQFTSVSTAPLTMDASGNTGFIVGLTGAPDLSARSIGPNAVAASLTEPEVPWGEWVMFPTLVGPFGPAGAPPTPVTNSVVTQLRTFDGAVSADSGDVWSDITFGTNTYNPLVLGPGQTGTINVTIAPSLSQVGTTVHGVLYIDTFNGTVQTGDEVVALPYSYTVTK